LNREALTYGIVYTETVVHTPPERYVTDAPYQIGIVEVPGHGRLTARIIAGALGERARIGDRVWFSEWRDEVPYFSLTEKAHRP
jgi:uncharacterized OB-fold protein